MSTQELLATIKKNPTSFACGALSVLIIAGIYFRSDQLPQAQELLSQKTAQGEKITMNIKYAAQLKEQTDAVIAANKEIEGRVVRASQLGANTGYFYKLESETGVKMIDLRQTTPSTVAKPAKGSYLPVAFAVTVQGELNQLLEWLRQLENGAHYARVMNATLSGNSQIRNNPLTLALTLELLGTP
jgi:hypothetical protein